ncbi:hypothetical protein PFISCL1PPCAC_8727 [Pristionchus fissidentatus]|uniref:Uncharacterized protein n=1 Tax=Pristionchus fissidentatus TaxID=1538716 RepID=A0AAV5VHL0_9BILA|nr:hypothetical protein PFISCL1PPCAC_8727 [Pristionchus fissidentatus]
MFARPLDCFVVPQLSVEGEDYDAYLDEQPGFAFVAEKAAAGPSNIVLRLRNREISGSRRRPCVRYDVNDMDVYVRSFRRTGVDEEKAAQTKKPVYDAGYKPIQASNKEHVRAFADSNICAVNPEGTVLVRSRIDDEDDRVYDGRGRGTKLVFISKLAPKYLVWPISLILEDVPLSEPGTFLFSKRNGLIACMTMDTCVEESRGPSQGVIRVDLFVPWAGTQICSINTACLAQRTDKAGRPIEKRCIRVHDRGVAINCGFQIVFITVTPKALQPLAVPGEVRKTYYFQPKSYLGVQVNARDAVEKRHDVDVGETLSCRFTIPFPSRVHEHGMKTRLELRPHPAAPATRRLYQSSVKEVGHPTYGCKMFMSRQVLSIETLTAAFLTTWYAVQQRPAKFVGTMDYESDILHVDDASCTATVGVFVKAEVRYALPSEAEVVEDEDGGRRRIRSPREKTQFDIVYVEFDWLIIEGGPRKPRVCMRRAGIGNAEIFDKHRWYTGNARERFAPHEFEQRESDKRIIDLQPLYQPQILLQQRSKRNRQLNSQVELSDEEAFLEAEETHDDDSEEESQKEK